MRIAVHYHCGMSTEGLSKTYSEIITAFRLCRNLTLNADFNMDSSAPFPSAGYAPMAFSGVTDRPRAIFGTEAAPPQHEFLTHNGDFSAGIRKPKLTTAFIASIVVLAVIAAVGFLVFQCYRALTFGRSKDNHGINSRRLAEKGGLICPVSRHKGRAGHDTASQDALL